MPRRGLSGLRKRLTAVPSTATQADLAAVVMDEGIAHVCLVTNHMTVLRAKIEQSIPRKRRGSSTQHDKALRRFYDATAQVRPRLTPFLHYSG